MTILPRAATAQELIKIRSENQSSRIYLTIHTPATVFTARLATVPASTDNVASIDYNTGSGAAYTSIITGQTMYVGTTGTGTGLYDLGMVRIRNLNGLGAVTGTFNIGLTSEIAWSANCYLTVVDAFDIWPRSPFGDAMDYDIAYTDQHSHCASIPIYPRYHVKWLPVGGTTTLVLDGTQSWPLNNTITNYSWSAPGNSAISGDSTSVVTITYSAVNAHAGYRVALEITNSDNVDSQGYGRVFVLGAESDAITNFRVDSLEGSYSGGGWSAQITMWDSAANLTSIRDRALCILHRRDWYGLRASDEGSIGYVFGDENIEMVGWVAGETIRWAPHWNGEESVTFTIQGPQYWLNKLTMPAVGLKNISSHPPTNWKRFTGLTAKSATWHILYWRTTAPACIDCFPIDNAWGALQLQGSGAQTVWQQLNTVLNDFLLAKPCCDAYGRLFMQVEQNLLPASTRSSIPTVMTVTTGDWANQIDFERREVNDVAAVDISGDVYNGTTSTPTYALSPGRTIGSRGSNVFQRDRLVLIDQATTNAMAGAAMGWQNNPYPNWRFQFPSNLHLIDLAPYQYLATDIVTTDTQRGISTSGLRLIPRTIRRVFDQGVFTVEVDVEAETPIYMGITGDTPPTPPIIPTTTPPPPPPPPPPFPVPNSDAKEAWFATSAAVYWSGDFFGGGQPTWNVMAGSLPATPIWFGVAQNGSSIYMRASGTTNLYQCSNPKAGSPSWTAIATTSTATGFGNYLTPSFQAMMSGNTLLSTGVTAIRWIYSEYNGSAWTFYQQGSNSFFNPAGLGLDSWVDASNFNLYDKNHAFVAALPTTGESGNYTRDIWHRTGGPRTLSYLSLSGHLILYQVGGASIDTGATAYNQAAQLTHITGAQGGPQTYFVAFTSPVSGTLYLAEDGATFNSTFTWLPGWVYDGRSTGGGSLAWFPANVGGSNELCRISNNRGVAWTAMTGNFWSLAAGDQVIVGAGLVY